MSLVGDSPNGHKELDPTDQDTQWNLSPYESQLFFVSMIVSILLNFIINFVFRIYV